MTGRLDPALSPLPDACRTTADASPTVAEQGDQGVENSAFRTMWIRVRLKAFTLSRHLPYFRSAKITVIAIAGALCLAAPALTTAATSHSASAAPSRGAAATPAAELAAATSQTAGTAEGPASLAMTVVAVQTVPFDLYARIVAIKVADASATAARARALAAREQATHVAYNKHLTLLAAAEQAGPQQAAQQPSQQQAQQQAQQPVSVASGSPQQIAEGMLAEFGWSAGQFSCLDALWNAESGWNTTAENPNSGAYGIPQALPGSKMASAGPDWQTDPATQIRWGLEYIQSTYGSPCAAWSHEEADGWY
jgi:hypothetical protein